MADILVFAKPPLKVSRIAPNGSIARGAPAIGYGRDGEPLPDGEKVPPHPHYLSAIRCGELDVLSAEEAG